MPPIPYYGRGATLTHENRMDEDDWEFSIDAAHFDLMVAERQYENTKNPMYLWKLIKACLVHDQPLPPIAMMYLGEVADRLFKYASPKGKTKNDEVQGDVYRALFGDPPLGASPLRQFYVAERDFAVGVKMEAAMADLLVLAQGSEGEAPYFKLEKGATMQEAIEKAKPLAPELGDTVSFRRAHDKLNPRSGKNPRG